MCDSLNNEIGRLANSLKINHGGAVAGVAALVYVSACVFGHHRDAHDADLTPLLHVQRRCADVYVREQQLGVGCLDAALAELARANSTVAYLAAVPKWWGWAIARFEVRFLDVKPSPVCISNTPLRG